MKYMHERTGALSTDNADACWTDLFVCPKVVFRQSRWAEYIKRILNVFANKLDC